MSSKDNFPKVLFFLGAGSSKHAGVGTTTELVEEFRTYLKKSKKTKLLKLFELLVERIQDDDLVLDIEKIMMIIDKIVQKDDINIFKIYRIRVDTAEFKILPELNEEIKKFIQKTTMIDSYKIDYLEPFRSFPKPRTVISVNYDTAIEQFCNVYQLSYTDGFAYEWNKELFNNTTLDFHLLKLHGSIMWYKTDRNKYVKLPLPAKGTRKLIFGEKATPLILYPMQKWDFVEPLLENIFKFKSMLEDSDYIIFIGYSFRDLHILRLLHEVTQKNSNLIVIIIDPNARQIYEEKLHFYEEQEIKSKKIPSKLQDRVLCLNYNIEFIFEELKDIVINCQRALKEEIKFNQYVIDGHNPSVVDLIEIFANVGFIDKVMIYENRISWIHEHSNHINTKLWKSSLKLFLYCHLQKIEDYSNYWLSKFLYGFNNISLFPSEFIQIHVNAFSFPTFSQQTRVSTSNWDVDEILSFINEQRKLLHKLDPLVLDVFSMIERWKIFYNFFEGKTTSYKEFLQIINQNLRRYNLKLPPKLEKQYANLLTDDYHLKEPDNSTIVKSVLEKIFQFILTKTVYNSDIPASYFSEKYPEKRIYYYLRLNLFR